MTSTCLTRLRRELRELHKKPLENIQATPRESNLLEWHYVIEGQKGSPYEGGWYHGTVVFPREYPYKPPSLQMFTPSGRFKPNTKLCLSMSDFHPETWNPLWSVGTVLLGLYTFMLEDAPTFGSIVTTDVAKRKMAADSVDFNLHNKTFCELFPELAQKLMQMRAEHTEKKVESLAPESAAMAPDLPQPSQASWGTILALLGAVLAFTWVLLGTV